MTIEFSLTKKQIEMRDGIRGLLQGAAVRGTLDR